MLIGHEFDIFSEPKIKRYLITNQKWMNYFEFWSRLIIQCLFKALLTSYFNLVRELMAAYSKTTNKLTYPDYASFGFLLTISALLGVYYAIFDKKSQNTTSGYFLANKGLHPIPVAFSIMASFVSSIVMMGGPSEVYFQNTMQYYFEIIILPGCFLATITFIPIFMKLQVKSVYEVWDPIFGRTARILEHFKYKFNVNFLQNCCSFHFLL